MSNNFKIFTSYYNKIKDSLAKISEIRSDAGFAEHLKIASRKSRLVNSFYDDLNRFRRLRNIINHETSEGEWLAVPTDETVEKMKDIYEKLTGSATAYDIATKNIYTTSPDAMIGKVIETMKENVYTHIPVLDGEDFLGIFSESTVIKWLAKNREEDGFLLEEAGVGDIVGFLDKGNDKFNNYRFVAKDEEALKVDEMFNESVKKGVRLGAVFVTQNGKRNEGLLGIITSWDLTKIYE